ncbi:uncharacterized protein LOC141914558 [Tubulanus polymorphus]|uniref:uncharacterized protein LOC141914558 n=1 Tax=Tubulanus polymorphus TaxID=672921 RepID=UPI003DA457A9
MDIDAREIETLSCRRKTIYASHGLSIGFSVILIIGNILLIVVKTYLNLVYLGVACGAVSILSSCIDILIASRRHDAQCRVCRILYYCLEMFSILGCAVFTGFSFSWHYFARADGTASRLSLADKSFRVGGRRTEKLILHYLILGCCCLLFVLIMIKLCCIGSMAKVERKNAIRMRNAYERSSGAGSRVYDERVSAQSRWSSQPADRLMQYHQPPSTVSYLQPTAPPSGGGEYPSYNPVYDPQLQRRQTDEHPPSYEEAMSVI